MLLQQMLNNGTTQKRGMLFHASLGCSVESFEASVGCWQ